MGTEFVIHVVDDDEAVRDALGFLLESAGHAVRAYETATALLQAAPSPPGCVITDVRMPGMNGLELVRALKAGGSALPIIVITGHGDVPLAVEAMKAGAVDFIEKPFGDDAILRAVDAARALAGARIEDPQVGEFRRRIESLSSRERQVMDKVVDGGLNKTIAHDLGISPRTVEIYRANLMTKLGAANLSELIRMVLAARG